MNEIIKRLLGTKYKKEKITVEEEKNLSPAGGSESREMEVPIIGWTAVFLFCGKCNGKMEFDGYDVKESGFKYKCPSCGNVAFTKNTYPFTRFQYNTSEFREYDSDDGKEAK